MPAGGLLNVNDGKYRHPYQPYLIQKQFMDAIYQTLNSKKIGIFESPTGTGKTLSLICPALVWLRNRESDECHKQLAQIEAGSGPQWAKKAAADAVIANFKQRGEALKELRLEAEKKRSQRKPASKQTFAETHKRQRPAEEAKISAAAGLEAQFCLPDTVIPQEALDALEAASADRSMDALQTPVKIFFASRTHSQLEQLVGSLQMLQIPAAWSDAEFEKVRHVSLGSRKQLCINKDVSRLKIASQINDRCMELQANSGQKCEFRKPKDDQAAYNLQDKIMAEIMDIEDLHNAGEEFKICPYYGSRNAIDYAEVITLPYPLLLQPQARAALGIDLKGSVVIIDEAHNLIDVISSLNSASITLRQVKNSFRGLEKYMQSVGKRLSMANRNSVMQLMRVIESLMIFLEKAQELPVQKTAPGTAVSQSQFLQYRNADVINLFELQQFLSTSHLAFKVDSYLKALAKAANTTVETELVLQQVVDFLAFALDPLNEGKLFFDRTAAKQLSIKYLLLSPKSEFEQVVEQAQTVILAGGTMEPVTDIVQQLFPLLDQSKIELFSCGHIIPESHLLADIVGNANANTNFEFTFANRNNTVMLSQLGGVLLDATKRIPGGIVVFFPSFAFMDSCLNTLKKSGIFSKLSVITKVCFEDKLKTTDTILNDYGEQIRKQGTAMLFAVVGGRLSEGINFSDDLARGVIMVGLPFPNAMSAEITARKDQVVKMALEAGATKAEAEAKAREYYENLSMRAVNQSIGRAIRHINDYAAILLVDSRYSRPNIRSKLSKWILEGLDRHDTGGNSWPETQQKLTKFFTTKPSSKRA